MDTTRIANQTEDFASVFKCQFESLTGNLPLHWQERLFQDHFIKNDLCSVIDLPTGLGKTMVMAIWLIARSINNELPRRLIYVVDRRTVIDQATTVANRLRESVDSNPEFKRALQLGDHSLPISTLRGQRADNRDWSRDPSIPAIIIGTVDLIGSALLFSGYRSSYKRRPLEAGLLGQDSLLVLDEAHLSKPFEKLICAVGEGGSFQKNRDDKMHNKPMRVIRMSATSGQLNGEKPHFTLQFDENGKLIGQDEKDKITTDRFGAKKRLAIITLGEKDDLNKKLAEAAIELARKSDLNGKRIAVFVRSPDDARNIAEKIRNHAKPNKSKSNPDPQGPYADSVEVLTGTMRGLERDELVEKPVFKDRWLNGKLDPSDPTNQQPVFLISTSAGEVGFDLNADHLVGGAAPLDSWIQRLGRVNRRGTGDATVILIRQKEPDKKTAFDNACIATSNLFTDGMDVSPMALAAFKKTLSPEQIDSVSSPKPTMVELTDILLDAWSMTSITERMPGRPEVAPWLRGIAKDLPQTTIAWRAELDLFKDESNPKKALKAIFAKHRIRPHESLTTNSYRVVDFLNAVTAQKKGRPELRNTRVVVKFSRDLIVTTIGELIDDPGPLNADPTLILPASFGGLDSSGMLSHEAILPTTKPDEPPPRSFDRADEKGYEPHDDARARIRLLIERTDAGWKALPLPGGEPIPADLSLDVSYEKSTLLMKAITKTDLRVRLVQPISFDDEGTPVQSLVLLAPVGDKSKKENQLLVEHVGAVEAEAQEIIDSFGLNDPIRRTLLFAAKWHDEGKKADIWQRFIGGPDDSGEPLGKAATTRDPKSLRGYRHEFGSLLRIHHPRQHATDCSLPTDAETRDLALHLIATHHGFGRPHFDNPKDRDFQTNLCDVIHVDAIHRFACLQRTYGWWHLAWLENLLRCADALGSADLDAEDDDANEMSEEAGGKA